MHARFGTAAGDGQEVNRLADVQSMTFARPLPPRRDNSKKKDVRIMNIEAAKAVADAVRTSLGPRGMDKMVSWEAPLNV